MNRPLESYLFQEELYTTSGQVVVVVSKTWEAYSEDEKILLYKILGSVKIDPASVRVLSASRFSFSSLPPEAHTKILIFGSETTEIQTYQPTQAQGFTVVKADDLTQLDDTRKKSLWVALKQMFSV